VAFTAASEVTAWFRSDELVVIDRPRNAPNITTARERAHSSANCPAEDPDTATWSNDERLRLKRLQAGETVAVNMRSGGHLWRWALAHGLAVRIDRRSPWGNPFVIGRDGDRDAVCERYEAEWPHDPQLPAMLDTLVGKALGCWCAPQRCHGDFLAEQVTS
jgi:hypothetical protein